MMKSTQYWPCNDLAVLLHGPMARRILEQGQMRPGFIVIAAVGSEDPAQMGLAEDDDVIEAVSAGEKIPH